MALNSTLQTAQQTLLCNRQNERPIDPRFFVGLHPKSETECILTVCSEWEELQMSQESKYRKFSKEFRESALRRLAVTANVSELCRALGISRQLLYWWRE